MPRFELLLNDASLADRARDRIRSAILEGTLKPGEKITIERVAKELGISRTPVREALKALEVDGMVRLVPHRGAIVEPLAWREIEHRYVIREMLEGYAAELACEAADEKLISALERHCERLEKVLASTTTGTEAKLRVLAGLNHEFHSLIWNGSQSPTLVRIIESLRLPSSFSEFFWSVSEYRESAARHHSEIAAAFRARDSKAARELAENHLRVSSKMIASAAKMGHLNQVDQADEGAGQPTGSG